MMYYGRYEWFGYDLHDHRESLLWGLLIFGAVLVARYVWPGQTASSSPADLSPHNRGTTVRPAARSTSRSTNISCRSVRRFRRTPR